MSKKIYVLDTNVPIQSPYSLFAFDDNEVVFVDVTLEELDNLKTRPGEVGANARETNRILEELRQQGNLIEGVPLPNGGILRIETNHLDCALPEHWEKDKPDNRIIRASKGIREAELKGIEPKEVILVSQDIAVRLKADLVGLEAEEYRADSVELNVYTGRRDAYIHSEEMDSLHKGESILPYRVFEEDGITNINPEVNEFFILHNFANYQSTVMVRYNGYTYSKINDWKKNKNVYGVSPRNAGQMFALEALMLPASDCPLVILNGPAGTAKTFLSLAAGLENVINGDPEHRKYKKMLVSRPNVKFDETIGFLKGTEEDKIGPLMRPIFDNLEELTESRVEGRLSDDISSQPSKYGKKSHKKSNSNIYNIIDEPDTDKYAAFTSNTYIQDLFDSGLITMQALEYMRGRSIPDTYIVIDEAQNMSPTQAFGIISRAGINTKIVMVGDPDQIDNPRLDKRTNGLSFAMSTMKGSRVCSQLKFTDDECVRSALAKEAIKRMSPKGYTKLK